MYSFSYVLPSAGGGFRSTPLLAHIQGEDDAEWSTQCLPPNFAVIGTVNMDETTQAFSRKVLDRAFTIELSDIDLRATGQLAAASTESKSSPWPASWWLARYRRISDVPDECTLFDTDTGASDHNPQSGQHSADSGSDAARISDSR
jgi:hypothetical protein